MKTIALVLVSVTAFGQSLRLTKAPSGSEGTMILSLSSGAIKPSALQWEVIVPTDDVILEKTTTGKAAKAADKIVQCGGQLRSGVKLYAYRCIVAGGTKLMDDGAVAEMKFKFRRAAGPIKIRLENAKGVAPDLKPIEYASSDSSLVP